MLRLDSGALERKVYTWCVQAYTQPLQVHEQWQWCHMVELARISRESCCSNQHGVDWVRSRSLTLRQSCQGVDVTSYDVTRCDNKFEIIFTVHAHLLMLPFLVILVFATQNCLIAPVTDKIICNARSVKISEHSELTVSKWYCVDKLQKFSLSACYTCCWQRR